MAHLINVTTPALVVPGAPVSREQRLADEVQSIKSRINGDLPGFEVFNNQVLVVKFIRTTVGSSGRIHAPEQVQKEDNWQGKCGLVIKLGPSAFVDDTSLGIKFYGKSAKAGDWVVYRASDGIDFDYVSHEFQTLIHCRLLEDAHVRMTIPHPDMVL